MLTGRKRIGQRTARLSIKCSESEGESWEIATVIPWPSVALSRSVSVSLCSLVCFPAHKLHLISSSAVCKYRTIEASDPALLFLSPCTAWQHSLGMRGRSKQCVRPIHNVVTWLASSDPNLRVTSTNPPSWVTIASQAGVQWIHWWKSLNSIFKCTLCWAAGNSQTYLKIWLDVINDIVGM